MKLQYHGDNKLHQFKQTWLEILNRMRQEDIPSEKALRDCLYNKIKDSPAMKWELGLHYENLSYDDPKRSYGNLLNIVDRTIMRRREQSNLTRHKLVYAKCWKGRTFSPFRPRQQHLLPMGNLTKGMESLTMQLPCSLRARPKLMLRQKAKPKKAARSESTDSKADKSKKHIRCKFRFTDTGCRNGDKCPFSHSKKIPETPPRSRTPSPSGRTNNQVCLPSERQDRVHGKTAHSSMKQRQQPQQLQQRRQMRKRSPRLSPSRRLTPVLRQRRLQSQRLSLPLLRFECAEHGIHWRLLFGRGPRTWQVTSQNALLLIAT